MPSRNTRTETLLHSNTPRVPARERGKYKIKGEKEMQKKAKSKKLSRILCMMLIVAMALCTVGCNKKEQEKPQDVKVTASAENAQESGNGAEQADDDANELTVLGEGKVAFKFSVMDKDGNETMYEIHTDKTIVGEALLELGLIEGDAGEFGLYVKKVNGITADYDVDKTYWAFYINGEYAMSGVDMTPITEGDAYMFKVEK